jgi:stress response protein YsnF
LIEASAKTEAGYFEMEDKDRAVFDSKREALIIERKAFDDADRKAAGYADMDND